MKDSSARPEEALWAAYRTVACLPHDAKAQELFRTAAIRAGQREKPLDNAKIRALEEALRKEPDNLALLLQLAKLYRLEHDFVNLMRFFRKLQALAPPDPYTQGQIASLLWSEAGAAYAGALPASVPASPRTVPASPPARTGPRACRRASRRRRPRGRRLRGVVGPPRAAAARREARPRRPAPAPGPPPPCPIRPARPARTRRSRGSSSAARPPRRRAAPRRPSTSTRRPRRGRRAPRRAPRSTGRWRSSPARPATTPASSGRSTFSPRFPPCRGEALLTRGEYLESVRRDEDALPVYEQARSGADADAARTATLRLAQAAEKRQDALRAQTLYEEILRSAPASAEALPARVGLAGLYRASGRARDARRLYEEILRFAPAGGDDRAERRDRAARARRAPAPEKGEKSP